MARLPWSRRGRRADAPVEEEDPRARAERAIRAYHERTKHHVHRTAPGPGFLDWDTQPDPFRRWEGAELLPLALPREGEASGPSWGESTAEGAVPPAPLDAAALARLLWASLGISAWKEAGPARWALRANPSSGNLHPTEAHLVLPPVAGLEPPDAGLEPPVAGLEPPVAGLEKGPLVCHYAPREHALEVRARPDAAAWDALALPEGVLLAGLASIPWRESWKYGERAYRYCHHDAGHALAALAIAASGLGWRARLACEPATDEVAALLGIDRTEGPEAEHADLLLALGPGVGEDAPRIAPGAAERFRALDWRGAPSALSPDHVEWSAIDAALAAAAKPRTDFAAGRAAARAGVGPPAAPLAGRPAPLWPLVRARRSAVAMDGRTGTTLDELATTLEAAMPRPGRVPFAALPWPPRVHLLLFVHRVEGLAPGLYWLARDPDRVEDVRARARPDFTWSRVAGVPDELPLLRLHEGDVRGIAAHVSCGQAIAGDGAWSTGMIGDLERALGETGPWAYPRLHWETGAVGQVLYLEAEAVGLRATGIGCFFDDAVHAVLGLRDRAWQSLYHFTAGGAVDDPRLTTRPAYPPPGEEERWRGR